MIRHRQLCASQFLRILLPECFIGLIQFVDFFHMKLRSIRDPGFWSICHRDLPGITLGINHRLFKLRIRHTDRELFPIFHGDRQRLFTCKGLHTDQCPVSGIHRLRIHLCDLLFRQLCTILTLQPTSFLNLTDRCLVLHFAYINQFRTAEFHRSHICNELLRRFTNRNIKCAIHSLCGGIYCRTVFLRVRIPNYTQHFYEICK